MKRRLLLVSALALLTAIGASGAAAQHNETGAGHLLDPILPAGMTQNADGSRASLFCAASQDNNLGTGLGDRPRASQGHSGRLKATSKGVGKAA